MMPAMSSMRFISRVRALVRPVAYAPYAQTLYWFGCLWRRLLRGTTFVAITGTHGKTTTKEMLAAMLASRAPTASTRGNENSGLSLTLNVLRVRPRHRFAVLELGVGGPGQMRRLARLVRPDLAVMLTVLRTHTRRFRDRDAQAREKAMLLRALRRGGVAVLNADDPRVAAMADLVRGTVVRSGTSPAFDVWAENATSRWPERLEFDVRTRDGESCHVRTRLVGTHWTISAVAALAVTRSLGVGLREAAAALATVEPFRGRMQPLLIPAGAVVLRDDYDGSIDTFEAGLAVLAEARADRRVAVIGDVSDYGNTPERRRVRNLGREIARVAEVAVFVGNAAAHGKRGALAAGLAPENVHAFSDLREAAAFLQTTLRRGDLVFLKGRTTDHLARLFFAQLGSVRCWKQDCTKVMGCDTCPELGTPPEHRERATLLPLGWGRSGDAGS